MNRNARIEAMAVKRIGVTNDNDIRRAVETAAEILENGGVVVFPTETVYGVGVASGNAEALAKLRRLKGRGADKPFQFLAADLKMAGDLGAIFDTRARRLANDFWPGPLTLVVPDGTRTGGSLGIRIPDAPFVRALCRRLGKAIISSSANPAGLGAPLDAAGADVFGDGADLLVDAGPIADGVPSTVVECGAGDYRILREGGVERSAIEASWNE